jgi:hypothetical protein
VKLCYWQVIVRREPVKLEGNLEDIINFAEVQRISIYRKGRKTFAKDERRVPNGKIYFKNNKVDSIRYLFSHLARYMGARGWLLGFGF